MIRFRLYSHSPVLPHFASAFITLSFACPAPAADFYRLTDLGGQGGYYTEALAINGQGHVAGFDSDGLATRTAFLWTPEDGVRDLGDLPSGENYVLALALNDAGQVAGYSGTNNVFGLSRAFVWSESAGMQDIGHLPGSPPSSIARAINTSGQVVGRTGTEPGNFRAFQWSTERGMQYLGDLPGGTNDSRAWAINASGQIAGQSGAATGMRAFLWTNDGGMRDLGDLPGGIDWSVALGINASGQIVGTSEAATGPRAFLWSSDDGMQDLGDLPGGDDRSEAKGLNDMGQVVGHSGGRPFLWSRGNGMQDLNSLLDTSGAGWTLLSANATNNAGQIVGLGATADGVHRAYLLSPLPNQFGPADLALVVRHLGQVSGAVTASGDFNGDGRVGLADVLVIQNHFGDTVPVSALSAGAAIPEPATISLAIFALGVLAARRRWRRHRMSLNVKTISLPKETAMRCGSQIVSFALAVAVTVAADSPTYAAITLTYEDVDYSANPNFNSNPNSQGYVHNTTLDAVNIGPGTDYPFATPAHSGSYVVLNNGVGDGSITQLGGGSFSFVELYIKHWSDVDFVGTVEGYYQSNLVASVNYIADENWTQVIGALPIFGSFENIDNLRITSPNNATYLIDDVQFGDVVVAAEVPEPSAWLVWLFLASMIGLIVIGHRRRLAATRRQARQP